jgi:hypothetical protein
MTGKSRSLRIWLSTAALAATTALTGTTAFANPVVPPGCYVMYDDNGDCLAVVCPWDQRTPFRPCDGGM